MRPAEPSIHNTPVMVGARHVSSISFMPLHNDGRRVLNARGVEVALADSNHNAMLFVLLANAGSDKVFTKEGPPRPGPDGIVRGQG